MRHLHSTRSFYLRMPHILVLAHCPWEGEEYAGSLRGICWVCTLGDHLVPQVQHPAALWDKGRETFPSLIEIIFDRRDKKEPPRRTEVKVPWHPLCGLWSAFKATGAAGDIAPGPLHPQYIVTVTTASDSQEKVLLMLHSIYKKILALPFPTANLLLA